MADVVSIISRAETAAPATRRLGERGELAAQNYLQQNGYRIVLLNFKVPVGRNTRGAEVTGEIDIIALNGDVLCFVEVKTRRSDEFADPLSAVSLRKQRQIIRTARIYRRIFGLHEMPFRYDAVTVLMPKYADATIELSKGFWDESRFRKRRWSGDVRDAF